HKRADHSRRYHGSDRVRTIMPPVRKIEQERQQDDQEKHSAQVRHAPLCLQGKRGHVGRGADSRMREESPTRLLKSSRVTVGALVMGHGPLTPYLSSASFSGVLTQCAQEYWPRPHIDRFLLRSLRRSPSV